MRTPPLTYHGTPLTMDKDEPLPDLPWPKSQDTTRLPTRGPLCPTCHLRHEGAC